MKKVKSIRYGNALVCSCLAILLLFSVAQASNYKIHSLMAGQNIKVGDVSVWNDADHLYVKYETRDGWYLIESHVHFATSVDGIPQKNGNPIPGSFDYAMEHDPEVLEYTYEMDLNGLEPGTIYIATHADVLLLDQKGKIIQEESAWGDGEDFLGANWATYFTYETDSVPPSIGITNPVNGSTITNSTPYITIEFSDDDSGIELSSFSVQINGVDCTGSFDVTDTRATYEVTAPLAFGSNAISASISDNAGNAGAVACDFTIGSSGQPNRYIFSVNNNDWIFASPGDGTCTEYLSREDLGVLSFLDVVALSKVTLDGNLFFTLSGQGGILQSPCDGSNSLYFNNTQLGLGDNDQICAEHTGLDGSASFSVEGVSDIYQSSGANAKWFLLGNSQLGIGDDVQVGCIHIGYEGKSYFCRSDEVGIFQSDGGGTNTIFLTASNLGVPGSTIDAFAILPDTVPPEITITNPMDGAFLNTTTPNITVTFQDTGSGIDAATFYAEINGTDMTSAFAVTDTGATYQVPSASPLPVGDNSLTVKIQDYVGNETGATSNFMVGTLRAIPGATPTSGTAPLTVYFTTDGEDPAGTIEVFRWDFDGNGTWDTYDTVARDYNRTYNTPGTYNATLYVRSSTGESTTASITITAENNPPVATADVVPSNGEVPLTVQLMGSGTDSDGSIVLYEWDFEGDGIYDWSSATSGNTTYTYTPVGIYQAVFRVTDDSGLTDTATAATTVVRTGHPGSPTAIASASPTSGNAPLTANFNGTATDPDNNIVLYEWDFDGDGTYDWSSSTTASTSNTYSAAGTHVASFRVTDETDLTGIDQILITVNIQTSLSVAKDTVTFLTGTNINTSISAGTQVSILIKNSDGNTVRTLVNNEYRNMGSYADYWDCKDDNGIVVNDGVHYAILQYIVDGQVETYDLTNSTGGTRYSFPIGSGCNTRADWTSNFSPFEDQQLALKFTICSAQEVTAFIGPLWSGADATRIATIVNRQAFPAGTHTIYWDGLDDNGNIAQNPPGDSLITGFWRYDLPDNVIYMTGGNPTISNISADPNYFSPFSEKCDENGNDEGVTIDYTVSENVASVEHRVYSIETGSLLRTLAVSNVPAGDNVIFWDGKNNNGEYVDIGDYRVGLIATDAEGNESMFRYCLVRIDY